MENSPQSVLIFDEKDNVATAVQDIIPGTHINENLAALERIPFAFKIALRDIPAGQKVIKYGICIGLASQDIPKGACVHIHNAISTCDHRSAEFDSENAAPTDMQYSLTEASI